MARSLSNGWLWLPWRWRKIPQLDESLWGPSPSWWTYTRCAFWNWRNKWLQNAVHWLVCGTRGHDVVWREPSEFDWTGHWGCNRCPSWFNQTTDEWVELW